MAKETFKVASDEGAVWAGVEAGEEVELDLDKEKRTALLAAGWIETTKGVKK
jgi:hypothetical protein